MAEGISRHAALLRRFPAGLRTVWITADIGHTTDAKESKQLTDRFAERRCLNFRFGSLAACP